LQRPAQHWPSAVHALPRLAHPVLVLMGAHLPLAQFPVQHTFPWTGHVAPLVKH
jgi:hypothetical protein